MKDSERIAELESEVRRLKAREEDLVETRRAMLYLLEDLNATTADIARAKNEWEATFDSISDPLFIHDRDLKVLRCNRAYQKHAGQPFERIVGRPYHEVFPKMPGTFKACTGEAKGVRAAEGEEQEVPEAGKVFKVKSYSIRTDRDPLFLHVMVDITEARRAEQKERFLNDFSQKIAADIDIGYRRKTVCEWAQKLGYESVWLGEVVRERGVVRPVAWCGGAAAPEEADLSDGASALAGAVEQMRPVVCGGPGLEGASSAAIPLLDDGAVREVLVVVSALERFPEREVPFLRTFASHANAYMKNSMLFEKVAESAERIKGEMGLTESFLDIATATSKTTDIHRLMEHVVVSVKKITGSTATLAYLWSNEKNAFLPCRAEGLDRGQRAFFRTSVLYRDTPVVDKAFGERGPIVEEPGGRDRLLAGSEGDDLAFLAGDFKKAVVVPLYGRKGTLGVLVCLYGKTGTASAGELSPREMKLLSGISSQVSVALDEARMYKDSVDTAMDLSRKVETIQTMHEIDMAILSTLEPKEILETSAMMIARLVPCDRATIALYDEERGGFVYAGGFGLSIEKDSVVPFDETSTTEVIKTLRPQFIPNLSRVPDLPKFERGLLDEGFLSHIRVPLMVKNTAAGVLTVGAKRKAAFTPEDLSLVEKLASQVSISLENSRLVLGLEELFIGVVRTLSEAIDAKSPWTRGHSDRVTAYALEIGRTMGLGEDELKRLELAGLLHDVGKLGTYEAILDKPGALTDEELKLMRKHPEKGLDILGHIKQMGDILPVILHHHEHFDGSGYPRGLRGSEIPLMARILTVADTVDAMGADRPYRKGKSPEAIVAELKRCSGTQFDPEVVGAFLKTMAEKVA